MEIVNKYFHETRQRYYKLKTLVNDTRLGYPDFTIAKEMFSSDFLTCLETQKELETFFSSTFFQPNIGLYETFNSFPLFAEVNEMASDIRDRSYYVVDDAIISRNPFYYKVSGEEAEYKAILNLALHFKVSVPNDLIEHEDVVSFPVDDFLRQLEGRGMDGSLNVLKEYYRSLSICYPETIFFLPNSNVSQMLINFYLSIIIRDKYYLRQRCATL